MILGNTFQRTCFIQTLSSGSASGTPSPGRVGSVCLPACSCLALLSSAAHRPVRHVTTLDRVESLPTKEERECGLMKGFRDHSEGSKGLPVVVPTCQRKVLDFCWRLSLSVCARVCACVRN